MTRDTVTAAPPPDEPLFTQQAEGPSLASSATEPDQQALLTLLGAETHTVEACATALGWQMERCLSGLVALEVAQGRWLGRPTVTVHCLESTCSINGGAYQL